MALPVTISYANPDPNALPTTITELIALLRTLTTGSLTGDFIPYVIGDTTPDVEDQDKLWMRLYPSGSPRGIYKYYGGRWVRSEPDLGGRIGMYIGSPAANFDANGLGLPGIGAVAADYFGWQIANGNHGTPNWSDKFLIGGRMDNVGITGYDAGTNLWRTNVDGVAEHVGGENEITLDADNTFEPATTVVRATHYSATGNTQDSSGGMWGQPNNGAGTPFDLVPAAAGNLTPDPIPIIPPFEAVAYIFWVGYDVTP